MDGKATIIVGIMVLVLLGAGAFLVMNSLTPLEKRDVILNDSFNVPANNYANRTAWISSSGQYIASFTVSQGTIKFYWVPAVELWLEGKFRPDWIEADSDDYGFSVSLGQEGEKHPFYYVFLNNDTVAKEVHFEVSKVWKETNYMGLLGGAALVLSGIIIATVLKLRHRPQIT